MNLGIHILFVKINEFYIASSIYQVYTINRIILYDQTCNQLKKSFIVALKKFGMNGEDVMKKRNKIQLGKTNLLSKKVRPQDEMIMISIKMEGDLLDALKLRAKEINRPYQTLMKDILRESLGLKKSIMDDHIREIVRQEIKKRSA